MTEWNLKKISNKDLQKLVKNYNNSINRSIKQAPKNLHFGDDAEKIKSAGKALKTRAEISLLKNARNFPTLRIGDSVRVSKDTSGKWRRTRTFKN